MFLAGLFLPVIALPKPAQCDHGYQTQALPLTELCLQAPAVTVPRGILIFLPAWGLLWVWLLLHSRAELVGLLPCSLIPFPAKSPFSSWIWRWSQEPNFILHAEILSGAVTPWAGGWEPWMLLVQQDLLHGGTAVSQSFPAHSSPDIPLCSTDPAQGHTVRWTDSVYPQQNSSNSRLKAVLLLLAPFIELSQLQQRGKIFIDSRSKGSLTWKTG